MLRTETCRQYSGRMAVILRPESSGHIFGHIHPFSALVVQAQAAWRSRAFFSRTGSSLPRAEALRSIPRQAFGLKEYFSGTLACKICDKVDALSALGHSPVLSIKYPPCD